jgi:hypothetical protein
MIELEVGPLGLREACFFVWERLLNTPYKWGGDDPMEGVDCSGLVREGLKSAGLVPREMDTTADALLKDVFKDRKRYTQERELSRGMLVFWQTADHSRIRHVEIVWRVIHLQDEIRVVTIGASGGGSKTVDRAEAIKSNAYVKIRRITPGWFVAIDPFEAPSIATS